MYGFLVTLVACSVVMSLIALLYMATTPFLAKRYSEKARYYVWLIILLGLIPFRPQWSSVLIRVDMPIETVQTVFRNELPNIYILFPTESAAFTSDTLGFSLTWWQMAFSVWLIGLIVFLALHIVKHCSFVKKAKRWGKCISDEKLVSLLQSLKSEMGISRHIGLAECEGIGSPMLLGFVKPQILLPIGLYNQSSQDELGFILKHELIHYKRGDLFYKCLVLAATAVHWFNPVIYMAARAINALCELSCDAEIVQSTDDDTRQKYSEAIIGVVRYQSKFKTALSTNFYGGKKGMKNRIATIMTTSKKKVTLGSMFLAVVLVSVLAFGTLTAFAAERPDPDRPFQNIGRRIGGRMVLNPEWEAKLQGGEVRFYELDQVTPFDFSRGVQERLNSGEELFFIGADGRRIEVSERPEIIQSGDLGEFLGVEFPINISRFVGKTIEELEELGFDIQVIPRTVNRSSYSFMRELGKTPIIGTNGEILMWVPQSFFEMTYDEFSELAEKLLTTAVIPQTQETVDILREFWLAAR